MINQKSLNFKYNLDKTSSIEHFSKLVSFFTAHVSRNNTNNISVSIMFTNLHHMHKYLNNIAYVTFFRAKAAKCSIYNVYNLITCKSPEALLTAFIESFHSPWFFCSSFTWCTLSDTFTMSPTDNVWTYREWTIKHMDSWHNEERKNTPFYHTD